MLFKVRDITGTLKFLGYFLVFSGILQGVTLGPIELNGKINMESVVRIPFWFFFLSLYSPRKLVC